MIPELVSELQASLGAIEDAVASVTEEQAATPPAEGQWSINLCLEHLFLAEAGTFRVITKPAETASEGQNEIAGKGKLQHILKNRTVKVVAPEHVTPTGRFATKEEALKALTDARNRLIDAIKNNQIVFDGHIIPHPRLGNLTRLDWINFLIGHANRHVEQLQEIKAAVQASAIAN